MHICSVCSKPTDCGKTFEITLCPNCYPQVQKIAFEPKVNHLQSVTKKDTPKLSKVERFNFISLTIIIGTVVGIYLYFTDNHIKIIISNIYKGTLGQLSVDAGIIVLVVGILMILVLFARKK